MSNLIDRHAASDRALIVLGSDDFLGDLVCGVANHGIEPVVVRAAAKAVGRGGTPRLRAVVVTVDAPDSTTRQLCYRLRVETVRVPILVLAASRGVAGAESLQQAGADRVVVTTDPKVLAHTLAMVRRERGSVTELFQCGPFSINRVLRRVTAARLTLDLTADEFVLLEYLCRHARQVVSVGDLVGELHDRRATAADREAFRKRMNRLRRKLGPWGKCIETFRGFGYCVSPDPGARRVAS